MVPALFISHGAPDLVLHDTPERDFLCHLGRDLPRPRAIISVSAHFETRTPTVVTDPAPAMIYDFRGFPGALYSMVYPAPGEPEVAERIADRLTAAGFRTEREPRRGYDHGTWVPLSLIYPDADVPVVQLSIQPQENPDHHRRVGAALRPFLDENVLVMASGSLTHNLHALFEHGRRATHDAPLAPWVDAFGDWVGERVRNSAAEDLLAYRSQAPYAVDNHPTDEHLLPLFVAMGAAGETWRGEVLFTGGSYRVLRMDAFAFGPC